MTFDVARVRGLYPTLGAGTVHLDGPFNALMPETVIRAIITTLRSSPAQPGSTSPASTRAAASVRAASEAVADLVGAEPEDVVLGGNAPMLISRFAAVASKNWTLGDEVVLSRLDRDTGIRCWTQAARSCGGVVRWAEVDVETGDLPDWQYDRLIDSPTRVVTVPLANPTTGAVPDVAAIAERAHAVGALVVVDAGVALPHVTIDLAELGADVIVLSARTFGGPTVGALVARPGVLKGLEPDSAAPRKPFEVGPPPVELLDGVTAAVDHLSMLDEFGWGNRRERLLSSITSAGAHVEPLFAHLEDGLRAIPGTTIIGSPERRVSVLSFTIEDSTAEKVGQHLAENGISVWTGPVGMSALMSTLGVEEIGGTVHVGLMPHNTEFEVDQLVRQVAAFVG